MLSLQNVKFAARAPPSKRGAGLERSKCHQQNLGVSARAFHTSVGPAEGVKADKDGAAAEIRAQEIPGALSRR
jgi:hypothetical protein